MVTYVHRVCLVPQSYLTLYDSMDSCPPSSSVDGDFQARTLELVAISDFPRDRPNQKLNLCLLQLPALTSRFFITMPPGKPHWSRNMSIVASRQPTKCSAVLLAKDSSFKFQLTFLVVIESPQSSYSLNPLNSCTNLLS